MKTESRSTAGTPIIAMESPTQRSNSDGSWILRIVVPPPADVLIAVKKVRIVSIFAPVVSFMKNFTVCVSQVVKSKQGIGQMTSAIAGAQRGFILNQKDVGESGFPKLSTIPEEREQVIESPIVNGMVGIKANFFIGGLYILVSATAPNLALHRLMAELKSGGWRIGESSNIYPKFMNTESRISALSPSDGSVDRTTGFFVSSVKTFETPNLSGELTPEISFAILNPT